MAPRKALTQARVRQWALKLPEAVEAPHFDRPSLRVRNKIFATLPPGGTQVVLKTDPASLDLLVHSAPETFRKVWGERWVSIDLRRVDPVLLEKLLVDAWCLAAPKRLAKAYRAAQD